MFLKINNYIYVFIKNSISKNKYLKTLKKLKNKKTSYVIQKILQNMGLDTIKNIKLKFAALY